MSTVLVYSDDPEIRERVRVAVGRRPDPSLEPIDWLEANDGGALMTRVDEGGIDVCILDGEAAPEGGMGLSRQLKNEMADCPAILLLVMRRDDRWLAKLVAGRRDRADADRSGRPHRHPRRAVARARQGAACARGGWRARPASLERQPIDAVSTPLTPPSWPPLACPAHGR